MKRIAFFVILFLSMITSVMAESSKLVGLWSSGYHRQTDCVQFTEDGKCSSWYTVADSELGLTQEYGIYFKDCPYTFDEETMIATVTIGDRVVEYHFEYISDDGFRFDDDNHTSYYKEDFDEEVFCAKDDNGVEFCFRPITNRICEVIRHPESNYSGNLVIPTYIMNGEKGYEVVAVGDSAFYQCQLSSLHLPKRVFRIGNYAFANCSIADILVVETIVIAEDSAFSGFNKNQVRLAIPGNCDWFYDGKPVWNGFKERIFMDSTFNLNDYLGIETIGQENADKATMSQARYDIWGKKTSLSSGLFIEHGKVVLKK